MSNALGSWARPDAGWALVLPLVFLLLVRLRARPPEIVIGTLELWEDALHGAPPARRLALVPPAWALSAAFALLAGALAWLGPRPRADAARTWMCVVDRSPSMGLELEDSAGTRVAAAVARASRWLAEHAGGGDRVDWVASGRAPLALAPSDVPPREWFAADLQGEEPRWAEHDRSGTLWITDRAPELARAHAGLFASGGAAVAGAIAADGRGTVLWSNGELARVPSERSLAVVVREPAGSRLPATLERILVAWCAARGYALARDERPGTVLAIELEPGGAEARPLELGRDGWSARGRGHALAARADDGRVAEEDWLVAHDASGAELVVARATSGRLRIGLDELGEPSGDPASFALSWARLLDGCTLRPEGVVPLAERIAAGEARAEPGSPPLGRAGDASAFGARLDAALALACALGAVMALFLVRRA